MLNRRYLRIKVMQALYGYFQAEDGNMPQSERELLRSMDMVYDLYIRLLSMFAELRRVALLQIEEARNKKLPLPEDLNPNLRFVENRLILQLEEYPALQSQINARKISWQGEAETQVVRNVWNAVKNWDEYGAYMNAAQNDFNADRDFVMDIFRKHIADSDDVEYYIEEKNLHWPGDLNMTVAPAVLRTLELCQEGAPGKLSPLYKDAEEDRQFVLDLFRKTIIENDAAEALVGEKTKNWEVERIAVMDILLMKMAIVELRNFQSIPVKVTLNEYIEISKLYSTPKSKVFINGILDKLVADFRADGSMVKTGRGLME